MKDDLMMLSSINEYQFECSTCEWNDSINEYQFECPKCKWNDSSIKLNVQHANRMTPFDWIFVHYACFKGLSDVVHLAKLNF